MGVLKVDELFLGEMVKGKGSWRKMILTLFIFRGYLEKTRLGIEIEEWLEEYTEDKGKGKEGFKILRKDFFKLEEVIYV